MKPLCPVFPDKRLYSDKELALAAIKSFPSLEKRRSMNVYRCNGCGSFHVGTRKNYVSKARPR